MEDKTKYIDSEMESKAESILNDLGTDIKSTFNVILHKIVNKELSNEVIKNLAKPVKQKKPLSEAYGILKGKIWIADDFNAPLDCFEE